MSDSTKSIYHSGKTDSALADKLLAADEAALPILAKVLGTSTGAGNEEKQSAHSTGNVQNGVRTLLMRLKRACKTEGDIPLQFSSVSDAFVGADSKDKGQAERMLISEAVRKSLGIQL